MPGDTANSLEQRPELPRTVKAGAQSPGNSAALDQWRGLALLLVLVSHGFYYTDRVHGIGRVGVNLFFFISGILVFRSLNKPSMNSGLTLALDFWRRRLRRLYPALVAYVFLMLAVTVLLSGKSPARLHQEPGDYIRGIPFALAYTINYWPPDISQSLGHLWSLSCELQFYLLAPLIFLLGGQTARRRFLVWGTILLLLLALGLIGPLFDRAGKYRYHFEIAVWPMMLGFWCEYQKKFLHGVAARFFAAALTVSLLMVCGSTILMLFGFEMKKLVVASGAFICVPCLFCYLLGRPVGGWIGRGMGWLGVRTYSIYLWQQPLTISCYLAPALHPLGAALSALVGHWSFRLFERPFLSEKRKT